METVNECYKIEIPETVGEFLNNGGVKNPYVFHSDMDIMEAIRKMNTNGFSQVPVCAEDGTLVAYLSWDGIFRGVCKNNGSFSGFVSDYCCRSLDSKVISLDAPIRDALTRLQSSEFLIIVDSITELHVKGLITISDLSSLYSVILQGFTLISDIETRLRLVIGLSDVQIIELQKLAKNENINAVNDLTLGNFRYIMNNERIWSRLVLSKTLDRQSFFELMTEVKEIRNKIMHNNWLSSNEVNVHEDIRTLENFLNLLSVNI